MGRIKTDMVKRTTIKLVKTYPDKFSKKFDKNKEALAGLAEIRSKKLRNVIAGYAVRLKQQEEKLAPKSSIKRA
ncbi:30S ribosomal protein S17e [Candidatus Woesearchaeota archaeon]|nr:30S ribosomal protein S17e [Candidatus Woesearchaeota archaeon]